MMGDSQDIVARLRAVLPARWFPDEAPVLNSVLVGLAAGWATLFGCLSYVKAQARIATAGDAWLDVIARDYFGPGACERNGQPDDAYRARIRAELVRERGTRHALQSVLQDLTGRRPVIFEPANATDTGGWGSKATPARGLGYGVGGGWGSLVLPFQAFVTAYRPVGAGIAAISGWGRLGGGYGCGAIEYASLDMIVGQVTDQDIHRAVASVLPIGAICWLRVTSD